jgi:hypothetical protein
MEPPPAAIIAGISAFMQFQMPFRLIAMSTWRDLAGGQAESQASQTP